MNSNQRQNRLFSFPFTTLRKSTLEQIDRENKQLKAVINESLELIESMKLGKFEDDGNRIKIDHLLIHDLIELKGALAKVKQQEQEQKWVTEGLANFIEILRNDSNDLTKLCDQIISTLVKYMQINQGGLFIVNEELGHVYLDMLSCYAYDRKKFLQKRFTAGEGLLGQAYLEKQTIYMTEVPDGYVSITSGLGHATPRCILIVPLRIKEDVMGILELASFTLVPLYQIKFVEKLAESLASTILSVKTSENTAALLRESQLNSEELNAQGEEMRQNFEELQTIQEELARKSAELERVRESEKERTEKQLEGQKKIMEKVNKSFQLRELNYKSQIKELEDKLHQRHQTGEPSVL
jgi:hypothetical protein